MRKLYIELPFPRLFTLTLLSAVLDFGILENHDEVGSTDETGWLLSVLIAQAYLYVIMQAQSVHEQRQLLQYDHEHGIMHWPVIVIVFCDCML